MKSMSELLRVIYRTIILTVLQNNFGPFVKGWPNRRDEEGEMDKSKDSAMITLKNLRVDVSAASADVLTEIIEIVNHRDSYMCDHCDRQFDDSVCDKCLRKMLVGKMGKP